MARFETQTYILAASSLLAAEFPSLVEFRNGVTYRQWFMLSMLESMGPGTHTVQEVAEFVGTTRQNAKRLLVPLDAKRMVRMQRNKKDARALDIEMTAAGSRWLEEARPTIEAAFDKVFGGFSGAELAALAQSLQLALEGLETPEDAQ